MKPGMETQDVRKDNGSLNAKYFYGRHYLTRHVIWLCLFIETKAPLLNKKKGTQFTKSLCITQCNVIQVQFSSVQSLSRVWLFATPWIAARQAFLYITNSRSSLILTSIESVMPSCHLILCRPLLLLPPIPLSISSSNEYSGLISFSIDWFDLLAVQETLRSLLQHHSSEASDYILYTMVFLVVTYHCESMEDIVNSYVISLYGDIS